ncbi:hypothetical protein LXA43DRAFT_1007435 [Ganoderma leucocontextum]|nr:hypothetical protein LXA43DRAFT_1007435 [Ganoderma leucocontextum]
MYSNHGFDPNRNYLGIDPPEPINQPPTHSDIVNAVHFAMDVTESDTPHDGLMNEDAPPPWALPLIDAVRDMRNELQRANLPRMREDIDAMRNNVQHLCETFANLPQMKDDIETMEKELKGLPTKSYVSEKLRVELRIVKAGIKSVRKTLDSVKEDVTPVAQERLERTIAFTNELYIHSMKSSNMMKMGPVNLRQVPGPNGTLPWNTRVQGPDGEEIVLPPIDSIDAIQALEVGQVAAYVQLYFPQLPFPEDLAGGKRLVLQAVGRYEDRNEIV